MFYAVAEDSRVAFDVRRMPAMATTQTVTVRIDGDIVDQHVLADDAVVHALLSGRGEVRR